jgi:very-short-patch-repair endonuclease
MRKVQPVSLAKGLRINQTTAEELLWYRLRDSRLDGHKFRRQQPLDDYIVDFICFEKKLVIEVDGGQHNEETAIEKDKSRTEWLEGRGYRVLRFWNNDILTNLDGVMDLVGKAITEGTPSP